MQSLKRLGGSDMEESDAVLKRDAEAELKGDPAIQAHAVSPGHQQGDTDIAASAEQALKWNTLLPFERIRVRVDKGRITLQGEVEWNYQRTAAESAVRMHTGVPGIMNEIVLKPNVNAARLQTQIAQALRRQVEREIDHIKVDVEGSKVTLRGTVNSWHGRDAAQSAAWAAPGVVTVVNELRIA
jgi:osmotically-inducible protein OsmY